MTYPSDYECDGQLSVFDYFEAPYKIRKPIRLIELFAGVGSQAMALKAIGANFEHWKVVEFDKYAIASYNAIHGTNFPTMDITQIHGEDLEIVDVEDFTYLLTYSFPCTDLSIAGRMQGMEEGSGTRSSLLWEVKRLIEECESLPQVLLMENVPQVHSSKNLANFEKWLKYLDSKGYTTYWQDMNSKNYGVAQSRNRTIAVSFLGSGTYKFPKPFPLEKKMKDYLEDEVDERYYLTSEKAKILIDKLIIGGKILTDRQTDRQLTSPSPTEKPLKSQTQSLQDTTAELDEGTLKRAECVRSADLIKVLGNLRDEENKTHAAGRVYSPNGISPTIAASHFGMEKWILEVTDGNKSIRTDGQHD